MKYEPLDIPAAKSGDWEVRHDIKPAGTKLRTANMRTAMFNGDEAEEHVYTKRTRWHQLWEGESLWMSDVPIEQAQHEREIGDMTGRVLVGGLGLGLACKILARNPKVSHITVVEKSKDVINLVAPYTQYTDTGRGDLVEVVHPDLFEYLTDPTDRFDNAFYDIWASDGEGTFHEMVVPLRALSEDVVDNVVCWNEGVMRGQLVQNLHTRLLFASPEHRAAFKDAKMPTIEQMAKPRDPKERGAIYWNWGVAFWCWVADAKPSLEEATDAARAYGHLYGTTYFDETWDEFVEDHGGRHA